MTINAISAVGRTQLTDRPPLVAVRERMSSDLAARLDVVIDIAAVLGGLVLVTVVHGPLDVRLALAAASVWPPVVAISVARTHPLEELRAGPAARARWVLRAGVRTGLVVLALDPLLALPLEPWWWVVLIGTTTAASASGRILTSALTARCRLLVVGHEADAAEAASELARSRHRATVSVCSLHSVHADPDQVSAPHTELPLLVDVVDRCGADAVLVLPCDHVGPRDLQRLGWVLADCGVEMYVGTGARDVAAARASLTPAGGLQAVHIRPAPQHGAARVVKELIERAVAAVLLLILLPVLLAVAVAVRRDSPGPALFRQERVGRGGRRFTMLKFRTMHVTAEAELAPLAAQNEGAGVLFKLRHDPRITRAGSFLRHWSLDELPQLLNVLRGDMALVGPRPALPREVARYDADPRRRLRVKPGVTGLWQVSGRSDLSWEEAVRLDLSYVDNWSLRQDLSILLRTFGAVLGRRGAY